MKPCQECGRSCARSHADEMKDGRCWWCRHGIKLAVRYDGREIGMNLEERWEKLTEEFLGKLRGVPCSTAEFRDGLRYAAEQIGAEIQASKEMDHAEDD